MNFDELSAFIDNPNTSMEDLDKLANDIRNNQYVITRDDLRQCMDLLNRIKAKRGFQTFIPEDEFDFSSVSPGVDKGYAKRMRGPGSPKRSQMHSDHSILNNINGSVVATTIMMINVVVVGIMYIMMAIAKIKG